MPTVTIERETLEQWRDAMNYFADTASTVTQSLTAYMKHGEALASMDAALAQPQAAQPVFQSRPWSKEAEMLESWTQAQAAQPPPYCNICEGRGEVDTGIDESPVTICNSCNGTGIAQAAQPPRELVQQLVDVLTAESIRCDALTAGRAWLEANAGNKPPQVGID